MLATSIIETIPFRSAPAQNARPSPVTIATLIDGSLSNHLNRASSSTCPDELIQLRDFGLENMTRRTCSAGKEIFENDVLGGGLANDGAILRSQLQ